MQELSDKGTCRFGTWRWRVPMAGWGGGHGGIRARRLGFGQCPLKDTFSQGSGQSLSCWQLSGLGKQGEGRGVCRCGGPGGVTGVWKGALQVPCVPSCL